MQEGRHNAKPMEANGGSVEGHGGRIVRSTAKKDRHSKINTAKGPRDRRVRLSAHTAIQFYDVQDRLGYDQPSKAVDWLIEKAKASIDALAQLPPQNRALHADIASQEQDKDTEEENQIDLQDASDTLQKRLMEAALGNYGCEFQKMQHYNDDPMSSSGCFSNFATMPRTSSNFQSCPPELSSRTTCQTQNFLPSINALQDPTLLEHQTEETLFSSSPLCFNATPGYCFDKMLPDMEQFNKTTTWNQYTSRNGGGSFFNSSAEAPQPLFSQDQLLSRDTFQSNNMLSARVPMNTPMSANSSVQIPSFDSSSTSSNELTSDKFFRFPFLA